MGIVENLKTWVKQESMQRAAVVSVATLEGVIRHVVLAGEGIKSMQGFEPGMEIAVFVDGAAMRVRRKYSVYRFDAARGQIELLVHLHGRGPGSHWAQQLVAGDAVLFRGFSGRITLDTASQRHWFFGDATTLAPFAAICASARGFCEGFIEGDARVGAVVDALGLPFTWLDNRQQPSRLAAMARMLDEPQPATLYVAGAAHTVRSVQEVLLYERGFEARSVRKKNFWGER